MLRGTAKKKSSAASVEAERAVRVLVGWPQPLMEAVAAFDAIVGSFLCVVLCEAGRGSDGGFGEVDLDVDAVDAVFVMMVVVVVVVVVVAVVMASNTGGSGLILLSGVRGRCSNSVAGRSATVVIPGLMGDTVVMGRTVAANVIGAKGFAAAPAADLDVGAAAAAPVAAGVVAPWASPDLAFLRPASCALARSCRLDSAAAAAFAWPWACSTVRISESASAGCILHR